jgi:alpha/beta superfamily hydrolase
MNGPAGRLEYLIDKPRTGAKPRAAVVFGHPHPQFGGTMHTKAVFQGAKGLVRIGCVVLRFNFRGVGLSEGIFDEGQGESADYRTALDFIHAQYPDTPLWAAGFSFGAWVGLETGAADPRVSTLIGIAPPVPMVSRGVNGADPEEVVRRPYYSFPNTLDTTKPKFFVQGDLDELCPLKDMLAFYSRLKEPKELVVIDGASHLFEGKTQEVGEALEELLGDFE